MKFGPVPVDKAQGAILAHSLLLSKGNRIRKGSVLTAEMIAEISETGVETLVVAQPENTDVLEDDAAAQIAREITGEHLRIDEASTGRVNFFSRTNGVFQVSREIINAINAIDPSITIATLDEFSEVNQGRMVATIKIIPYAVPRESLDKVLTLELAKAFHVSPYVPKRIGFISTQLTSLKPSIVKKTKENLERRLALSGSQITQETTVSHEAEAVADSLKSIATHCDMVILFGASAISDICDVIPTAIEQAGGKLIRFGMPVDPGNLLLLAELDGKPVIGAPGCARSIAENGFDWVLQRLLAGIPITDIDVAGLGVGGLLMETGSRPHPRIKSDNSKGNIAAIILAAGQSRRMGEANKMTVEVNGKPMVRHVAQAALSANIPDAIIVTGHKPEETLEAVSGLGIMQAHNPDYAQGLSTSLATGISALPQNTNAVIILLGDMPFVTADMINQMIAASNDNPGHIIMATHEGKRGNPVLWPARFFDELRHISGDVGARHIIGANADFVIEVELGQAASLDLDTPEAVAIIVSK